MLVALMAAWLADLWVDKRVEVMAGYSVVLRVDRLAAKLVALMENQSADQMEKKLAGKMAVDLVCR